MAVPSYTEDLTDIDLAEATTNYLQWNSQGGGGNISVGAGPDFSMEGVNCIDAKITNTEKGLVFNNGAGISIPAADHIFTWLFMATPGLTDTLALRGLTVSVGTALTDMVSYHVEGNDTYGAGGRVGKCYVVDYSTRTANTGAAPYRTTFGTPGGTPQYFGLTTNITAAVKGSNVGLDAIRYGTGGFLTAGELISAGDASDDPCTFDGFATENDYNDATNGYNRWGIFSSVGGSYELQGTFAIGRNNAGTATLARFEDSDVNVVILDTPHSASNFTKIICDHASTVVNFTNISFTALGTNNRGEFTVTATNPEVNITGGTWNGLNTSILRSNTTVDGLTWRGCNQITTNGASLSNILIDKSTSAISVEVATLADIVSGTFNSDGSNHAVQLTGAAATYTWNGVTTGYDAGSSGNGVQVTGGSITGNETIHITATTGTFTINVSDGATTPSVSSAGAIVNVVAGQKTFEFTVNPAITGYEWRIYVDSGVTGELGTTALAGEETASLSTQSYSYSYTVDTDIVVQIISNGYEELIYYDTLTAADKSVTLNLTLEENV